MMKKKLMKKLKEQRGAEMLQMVLISGVLLVIIVTLFYPQMQNLLTLILNKIVNWFDGSGSQIFSI